MQSSHSLGQSCQGSSSPIFFTGCTKAVGAGYLEESEKETLSHEDFEKLKQCLNFIFANERPNHISSPVVPPPHRHHNCESLSPAPEEVKPVRPALLPNPHIGAESNTGSESVAVYSGGRVPVSRFDDDDEQSKSSQIILRRKPLLDLPADEPPACSSDFGSSPVFSPASSMPARNSSTKIFIEEQFQSVNCETTILSTVGECTPFGRPQNNFKRRHDSPNRDSPVPKRLKLPLPSSSQLSPRHSSFPPTRPRYHHSSWEQLSKDIWQLYLENKQTQAVYDMKMELRSQLHRILLKTYPHCALYVVGSSMTGLGGSKSDMDMCLMLSHSEIDQEQEAAEILEEVYDVLSRCDYLRDMELIRAKVPILRFRDSVSGVEVDLNVNNAVGIRNTHLLNSYARMDERVPPLVLLTKLWAKCHGINDAKNHTLSSYSLVLMVIHYLQYGCSPPVLPCLQKLMPDKFQPCSDVRTLKLWEELPRYSSENKQRLAELFLGFLNYFANEFDYANCAMSVRTGGILSKISAMNNASPKNKRAHWRHLCIEEPFNLTNTACSVFKDSAFHYVRDVFLRSWNMLRGSGNLKSILDMNRIKRK